jgi:hypothetical protein
VQRIDSELLQIEGKRGAERRRGSCVWESSHELANCVCSATRALARDNGQFGNVPPEIRAWFKSVKSHAGVPCCDIADGHRTDYDMREGQYWVPINDQWIRVPAEAVVDDAGNPTGDAVVWYTEFNSNVYIRCFVPGGGA